MSTCTLSPQTALPAAADQAAIDAAAAAVLAPVLDDLEATLYGAGASFSLTFTWYNPPAAQTPAAGAVSAPVLR